MTRFKIIMADVHCFGTCLMEHSTHLVRLTAHAGL